METKYCNKCDTEKVIIKFYKGKPYTDGTQSYQSSCIQCKTIYQKEQRQLHKVRKRKKLNECKARHRKLHPDRAKARGIITREILCHRIARQPCVTCGGTPTDAHHQDYSKPLKVTWLCRRHHLEAHNKVQRIELREEAADVRAV